MSINLTTTSIETDVKMVIWDLDDTFWNGTLAEGGVEFIDGNADIVRALAGRGIISSIASKNHYESAKKALEEANIWDYFVFPSISYDPKGKKVAEIIKSASLRAENILFIDDNATNLEEVRFFNPGIMVAQPSDIIPRLLNHPHFAGKADPALNRLKQYQLLQHKLADQQSTNLSNEEFLRLSKIEIRFDFDVDDNFDRVVDLIHRANQLNYTKRRLKSKEDVDEFRSSLNKYGVAACCVSCSDRYGDYGIIGFFMLKRTDTKSELIHFVFSCRTMNMGIEQFVYDYLGRPAITVIPEVAYSLDTQKEIDWISLSNSPDKSDALVNNERRLLLVGGCQLQQLSSFCSSNRVEFVNRMETHDGDDYVVRYDDPSFFTADREKINQSTLIKSLSTWKHEDVLLLDQNLAHAEIIILAMQSALRHYFVITKDNLYIRMETRNIKLYRKNRPDWFKENFSVANIGIRARLGLIQKSFEVVGRQTRADAAIFLVGTNTRKVADVTELAASVAYNKLCEKFCQENGERFYFVNVDQIVPESSLIDF